MLSVEDEQPREDNPECGNPACRRSLITRFGGPVGVEECPSCEADFERESVGGLVFEDATPIKDCPRCRGIGTLKPKFPRLLLMGCPVCKGLGTVDS